MQKIIGSVSQYSFHNSFLSSLSIISKIDLCGYRSVNSQLFSGFFSNNFVNLFNYLTFSLFLSSSRFTIIVKEESS